MNGDYYFSASYYLARKRFRKAARKAGARLHRLYWGLRGPQGEKLCIDIAVFGPKRAKRVIIHSSGVHGVEGFAGSAIQLRLLEHPPRLPADGALIVVHCANPYGMARMRRVNESNVDLNRNFLRTEEWGAAGAHEGYNLLHSVLNPVGRPPRLDLFTPRLALQAIRHGFDYLKQAAGEGQYLYPGALFFGGDRLEHGPHLLMKWLRKHLKHAKRVCAIDVHTGVGEKGEDWLIMERSTDGDYHNHLESRYGRKRMETYADNGMYRTRGSLDFGLEAAVRPGTELEFITEEFGTTVGGRTMLRALRDENRWFHLGADLDHPARRYLQHCFAPQDARWQRRVLENGMHLLEQTATYLFGRPATA